MHCEKDESNLFVVVNDNLSKNPRTAYIYVSIGSIRRFSIPVRQEGIVLTATPATFATFGYSGGTRDIEVTSNFPWTVQKSDDFNWIQLTPPSGGREPMNGREMLSLRVESNDKRKARSGRFRIQISGNADIYQEFSLMQEGIPFSLSANTLHFGPMSDSKDVAVATIGPWTATASAKSASWVHPSPASANGEATLVVSVDVNPDDTLRIGEVKINAGGEESSLAIEQDSRYFIIQLPDDITIPALGGDVSFSFQTNEEWRVVPVPSSLNHVNLSHKSGSGNASIVVSVNENKSINLRRDTIDIIPSISQPYRLIINQNGHILEVSPTDLGTFWGETGSSDSIVTAPVVVNTEATFQIRLENNSPEWMHIVYENSNRKVFHLRLDDNKTSQLRQGKVIVELTNLQGGEDLSREISLNQLPYGRYFTIHDYIQDHDWNAYSSSQMSIVIRAYKEDENWDDEGLSPNIRITVTSYSDDNSWDKKDITTSGKITTIEYKNDQSWDYNVQ